MEWIVEANDTEEMADGKFAVIDELVRCKYCKHNSLKRVSGNVFCDMGHAFSQLYDFCSDGERRGDDV